MLDWERFAFDIGECCLVRQILMAYTGPFSGLLLLRWFLAVLAGSRVTWPE